MTSQLRNPSVPIIYPLLTIQQAEERGVSRDHLLRGVAIAPDLLAKPDAKIPVYDYGHLIARALHLTGDPSLGYELGLRAVLSTHGLVGLGVMSHSTLRDALRFGGKYMGRLRAPGSTSQFWIDGKHGHRLPRGRASGPVAPVFLRHVARASGRPGATGPAPATTARTRRGSSASRAICPIRASRAWQPTRFPSTSSAPIRSNRTSSTSVATGRR